MHNSIEALRRIIEETPKKLEKISEYESEKRLSENKWSKKEILGHLIDSASNNHQRFVRGQMQDGVSFPEYEQASWVSVQEYQKESWEDLTKLWKSLNLHLLHLISNMPEERWQHRCKVGNGDHETLRFLVESYVDHLEHHLEQIVDRFF
ncbi:MAG: DinB family protein [Candidatus Tectomicrobia bacterium]|nr:DinB family protein [Candidatus Tectomicrobia bacterium]